MPLAERLTVMQAMAFAFLRLKSDLRNKMPRRVEHVRASCRGNPDGDQTARRACSPQKLFRLSIGVPHKNLAIPAVTAMGAATAGLTACCTRKAA
jgi:hypothetical protein